MLKSVSGDAVNFMVMRLERTGHPAHQFLGQSAFPTRPSVRQLLVCFEPAKGLACFELTGCGPWQRHLRVALALYISRDLTDRRINRLDDVRRS